MNSDLKAQLKELHITKAKEIELSGKKSIIIYVPVPQLKQFQKIQTRLVRELEKKFSGNHVVFVAERKILPKPTRKTRTKNKQKRPRRCALIMILNFNADNGSCIYKFASFKESSLSILN